MPFAPKPVCRRCRRRQCTCPPAPPPAKSKAQPTRERKSRPYDHAYRRMRDQLLTRHVEEYGWWCPGAPEIFHRPHQVWRGALDVDHINGDHDDHRPENLRVLCRTVNRGRKRVIDEVRRRRQVKGQM